MNQHKNSGYTLIEVMVAAALGVLLLGIVVTIYLGSKSTFRAAEGLARSQETTRFAMHFLKRDIRNSGYQGCSEGIARRTVMNDGNDQYPLSEESAVFGWEFNDTDFGDVYELNYEELQPPFTQDNLQAARDANTEGAINWVGNYIEESPDATSIAKNLPPAIADLNPLRGSDIIALTLSEPLQDIRLKKQTNQGNPRIEITDRFGADAPSEIEQNTILKIGDCSAADTFQNALAANEQAISAAPGGNVPGNRLTAAFKWQKKWDEDASIYQSTTKIYFIGTGAGGKPSLYVYESSCGIGGACGVVNELIEGVDSMQILYGEDRQGGGANEFDQDNRDGRDGFVDRYISADQVTDFRDVLAVKIGILVRSSDAALDVANAPSFELLDQITITPPDDRRQRFVNNATIRIHNRGL